MGLEDRVKEAQDIGALTRIVVALNQGENISVPVMSGFTDYIARTEADRGSEVLARYVSRLRNNPEALYRAASTYAEAEQKRFGKAMDKDYPKMIEGLKDPTLKNLALTLPEKSKVYLKIKDVLGDPKKVEERDIPGALELCASQFKYKANQELIRSLYEYPELALEFLQAYISFQAEKFENKNLDDKEVKDGKENYKFSRKKATDYVTKTIGSYKGNEKQQHYLQLTGLYQGDMKKAA